MMVSIKVHLETTVQIFREIGILLPNNQRHTAPCTSRRMCCPTHCASYCALYPELQVIVRRARASLWRERSYALMYRGTSLTRNRHPVGPYSRTMPRVVRWS